jgi:hypothetical protein
VIRAETRKTAAIAIRFDESEPAATSSTATAQFKFKSKFNHARLEGRRSLQIQKCRSLHAASAACWLKI